MPRVARIVIPNTPHHVIQRGNRGQDVFFSIDNRKRYLQWLIKYSRQYHFDILAYCLMTNHVHIVAVPRTKTSLSQTMKIVNLKHTQAINAENGWQGNLWYSRLYSTPLDLVHLWVCIIYVEQNPVRAGIVANAEDYLWSSAAAHCGLRGDPVLTPKTSFSKQLDSWLENLHQIPDSEVLEMIRRRTKKGIPCGNKYFVKKISKQTGQEYKDRPQGRPKKKGDRHLFKSQL